MILPCVCCPVCRNLQNIIINVNKEKDMHYQEMRCLKYCLILVLDQPKIYLVSQRLRFRIFCAQYSTLCLMIVMLLFQFLFFILVNFVQGNDDLALVQARWAFVNKDENLLTRLQNINLSFHFEVEQQVNGIFINFFGFNGTAGVWRIKALEESGGWLERTTVEDMDIAVRAHLCGWKFIFLNDVKVFLTN